jgi:hypothetical protein
VGDPDAKTIAGDVPARGLFPLNAIREWVKIRGIRTPLRGTLETEIATSREWDEMRFP